MENEEGEVNGDQYVGSEVVADDDVAQRAQYPQRPTEHLQGQRQ